MGKTIDEIYQEMLSVFGEKSGYLPSASCDLAARLYAAAAQIQALYLQAQWLLDQSFPQTARADYLDRYRAHCVTLGRRVSFDGEGALQTGAVTGLEENFALRVAGDDGREHVIFSGTVKMV